MNEKVLKTLEYNKILNQLSEYACSPEAKKRCLALRPITDKAQIEQLQLQTKDALSRLFRCGNLSFSGVHSVNDSLKRLEIGASLSAAELLSICSLLEAAKRVKAFSRSEKEEVPDDSLTGFFTEIEPLTPLYDEIKRCILAEDEIADDASSTLRSIRRSMRGMNDRIRAQMNNMINMVIVILTGIASISLLVGGIGIMNIMLVSVTERTREIGIRKALGAKERTILSQFVVEAATTSALGGALGIALGYIVSMGANKVLPMFTSGTTVTVSPSFNSIAVAFGISVGIGVLFGYLPAKRAARLNPIEALRYD